MKKLVVITGASSGIGKALAEKFSKEGHPLALFARRVELLEEMNLPNSICRKVDVTKIEDFRKAIEDAEKEYGSIDCLINNAGMLLLGDASIQDPEEWTTMIDLNIKGLLNGTHLVLKNMRERKDGTIINISSLAGKRPYPKHSVYSGTKFAVNGISESIRWESANDNVRVICVSPGAVETTILTKGTDNVAIDNYKNWKQDIGGVLTVKVIADSIFFAYNLPQSVCIRDLVIAPTKQMN